MLPAFLLPEQTVLQDGEGPMIEVPVGAMLQMTLGITEVVEQQSLDIAIYGSPDGVTWTKPLTTFPRKFYVGISSILLDLHGVPEVRRLKVMYKMHRWGMWTTGPRFRFYVFVAALSPESR